jgi:solute carrier family 25 iron transporter 28/37
MASTPSSTIHVHPHAAHLSSSPAASASGSSLPNLAVEEEEHEYEALPVGHGWATNMVAGAMAGISEHAAIFPVDSIKVSGTSVRGVGWGKGRTRGGCGWRRE